MTILNTKDVDRLKEPLFFGEPLGLQRYDVIKYHQLEKLTKKQLALFWLPEKISLQKDKSDFANLKPHDAKRFTEVLGYQIVLDSVQGRAPITALLPHASQPELEPLINIWSMMETIHSRSYTHIIKNLYPNPKEIFDGILKNQEILLRSNSVSRYYDDFIETAKNTKNVTKELKNKLMDALISVYVLEGIRFYSSFACTFAFAENGIMEGSAKIVSLIARDEAEHLANTLHIIKILCKEDKHYENRLLHSGATEKIFIEAVNEEYNWCDYIFRDGSILGLNAELLKGDLNHIADKRIKALGIDPIFGGARKSPLPWMKDYLSSGHKQVAPQETEVESYLVDGILDDVNEKDFKGFIL